MATLQSHITNYVGLEKTPTLTEDRLQFLESKINNMKNVLTAEALASAMGPYHALKLSGQMIANFIYKLHTLLMTIHTENYLRIFSELAHNLEVNLADVIIVERLLVKKWLAMRSDAGTETGDLDGSDALPFPPLILLVVFILVTPIPQLNHIFHTQIEPQPKHGEPPTFGKMLVVAMGEPEWPVIINWVGSLSVLLAMPVWFPEVTWPAHIKMPLDFQQDKAVTAVTAGVAVYHDVETELEEAELRQQAILLASTKLKGKKGQKDKAKAKGVRVAITSEPDVRETIDGCVVWKVPICMPTESGETAHPGTVFDVSSLITTAPSKPKPRELFGMLKAGGAAKALAKLAIRPEDTTAMFAPFGMFVRNKDAKEDPKTVGRSGAAGIIKSKATPEPGKKPPVRGADASAPAANAAEVVEWQGSIYNAAAWKECLLMGDEEESNEEQLEESDDGSQGKSEVKSSNPSLRGTSRSQSKAARGGKDNQIGELKNNKRLMKEISEEDDRVMMNFLSNINNYVETADEASQRLYTRLQQKLREPFCCTRHIYEQLKYFCPEKRAVICEQCTKEKYAGKTVVPLPTHCAEEIQRLSKKEEELRILVKAASDLTKAVPIEKSELHKHVDSEVDSLIAALNARREYLHEDIDRRTSKEVAAIERETGICSGERNTLNEAILVLEGLAAGDPTVVPVNNPLGAVLRQEATYVEFWKMACIRLHRPMGIATGLKLLLPVEELMKDAERLDWSVPKQYLSNRMYPPPDSTCPTLPSAIRSSLSTVQCNKGYKARRSQIRTQRKFSHNSAETMEVLRTRELADSLESVWGLVHCLEWRAALGALFRRYSDLIRTIVTNGGMSLPRYSDFYEEFCALLQEALVTHIAEGKYVLKKRDAVLSHQEIAEDLTVLPAAERNRLVTVDTMEVCEG